MSDGILVVGSVNHDTFYRVRALPKPHETIASDSVFFAPGGKGANQAAAAALATERGVALLGGIGQDVQAGVCTEYLKACGVDVSALVSMADAPTGTACVVVDDAGDNLIVISAGANGQVTREIIAGAEGAFEAAALVVLQFEIPVEAIRASLETAQLMGKRAILNPAPYHRAVRELIPMAGVLTPNQTEASSLLGYDVSDEASARKAVGDILALGAKSAIVTLGGQGSVVADGGHVEHVPAYPVAEIVDTTGAGDVFNGALAAALCDGAELIEAARFASAAAALSVQKPSAAHCAPRREMTLEFQASVDEV